MSDPIQRIDTLRTGDSRTLEFTLEAQRTRPSGGELPALRLLGRGQRRPQVPRWGRRARRAALARHAGLPAAVDALPTSLVDAAMRVLGQRGASPARPQAPCAAASSDRAGTAVTEKALALAEAGLRVTLGQTAGDSLRDLGLDWLSGSRWTRASTSCCGKPTRAVPSSRPSVARSPPPRWMPAARSRWSRSSRGSRRSGPDFVSFAVAGAGAGTTDVFLVDVTGRRTPALRPATRRLPAVPGAAILPLGPPGKRALARHPHRPDVLALHARALGRQSSVVDLSVTLPRATAPSCASWFRRCRSRPPARWSGHRPRAARHGRSAP